MLKKTATESLSDAKRHTAFVIFPKKYYLVLKLMPKGIVFKFTKHIKRRLFFGVLFRYPKVNGDF
jgi:hypothetical protein